MRDLTSLAHSPRVAGDDDCRRPSSYRSSTTITLSSGVITSCARDGVGPGIHRSSPTNRRWPSSGGVSITPSIALLPFPIVSITPSFPSASSPLFPLPPVYLIVHLLLPNCHPRPGRFTPGFAPASPLITQSIPIWLPSRGRQSLQNELCLVDTPLGLC